MHQINAVIDLKCTFFLFMYNPAAYAGMGG